MERTAGRDGGRGSRCSGRLPRARAGFRTFGYGLYPVWPRRADRRVRDPHPRSSARLRPRPAIDYRRPGLESSHLGRTLVRGSDGAFRRAPALQRNAAGGFQRPRAPARHRRHLRSPLLRHDPSHAGNRATHGPRRKPRNILRMTLGQGLRPALVGIVLGAFGAGWLSRYMTALLFGVKPFDLQTYAAVAALLIITAAVACYLPGRRAMGTDPALALRAE